MHWSKLYSFPTTAHCIRESIATLCLLCIFGSFAALLSAPLHGAAGLAWRSGQRLASSYSGDPLLQAD